MKFTTIFLSVVVSTLLVSCAPVAVTNINGPDGKTAYSLKCSGMGRDRQDCMIKAGELCPKGYRIFDDSSQAGGAVVTQNAVILARKDYISISCK